MMHLHTRRRLALCAGWIVAALLVGAAEAQPQSDQTPACPPQWQTTAERTGYAETGRYAQVVRFCRRLADASPQARLVSFGVSAEGRELPLLILSASDAWTPESAHADGKLVVLIQNCIHAGECAGKDASLALARDILITKTRRHLLRHVNLLIMPIFSADGHERFSPYSRINQNGPKEMGWRVTATNLNLNRDYTKADTAEMRAWLGVWTSWQPDFLFDNHTTNGSDHQYAMFYSAPLGRLTAPPIAAWLRETLLPAVLPAVERDGHLTFPYGGPIDRTDLSKGIATWFAHTPRFSTGYGAVCNRPTVLVEVHALKPYRERVAATYSILVHTLEALSREPDALRNAIRTADRACIEHRGGDGPDGKVVLRLRRTEQSHPVVYKAVAFEVRTSDISGGPVIDYSDRPIDVPTRLFDQTEVAAAITPPAAYLVPPQWHVIIDRLDWHGIESFRLDRERKLEVETCRFEDVKFPPRPYESRFQPSFKTVSRRETRRFPAGTVVVPLDQPRAKLAVHLLEPDAPDSLVRWGLINQIFERKEYFETYVMEPIARKMLAADAALRRAFEQRLREDEAFAKDPRARLEFFYERSPYFDARYNIYPIARLPDEAALKELRNGRGTKAKERKD